MHLNHHSLQQIDAAYIQSLELEALRDLSVRLLADLKEARDRLNQGPGNSSRPPSSRAPWERSDSARGLVDDAADDELTPAPVEGKPVDVKPVDPPAKRKPGKQPGAPGFGRTQVFHAHEEQGHYPPGCAGCGQPLVGAPTVAYTGFQAVDLRLGEPGQPGLTLWVVDYR